MDRSHYPALAQNKVIHLDASAIFPLHAEVIAAVNQAMTHILGAPGKAQYAAAHAVTQQVEQIREEIADFLHADISEIFFVASATDAARVVAHLWATDATVLYSPEDHSRIIYEITKPSRGICTVAYKDNGEYDYGALAAQRPDMAVVSHLHHVYGSDNNIKTIRQSLPHTKLVIDASQSVSRIPVNVRAMECDALFFSAQKIGGVAGVGVLYIAKKHHAYIDRKYIEPNTLPIIPLVSLQTAVRVINREQIGAVSNYLAKMTSTLIDSLQRFPSVHFTKGPAYPSYMCYGHGIVSFSVEGYGSHDIAMILADHGIQVRAGDHCVDPTQVDQDVVRISMHCYTTEDDLKLLTEIIAQL